MRKQKGTKRMIFEHILHRIGEASNPGPSQNGCHSKQRRLGNFPHQHHNKKDDKDMWCKEKGYNFENFAGDGNCLYACLGRSRKLTGDRVRQIIKDNADRLWNTHTNTHTHTRNMM
eukprot:12265784-Heterocapsa_arctica.AAC.1